MDLATLRRRLVALDFTPAGQDDPYCQKDRDAILAALRDGPDYPVDPAEVDAQAHAWNVHPAKVWAFSDIETSGDPTEDGLSKILPERHRFSKNTKGRFDKSHPRLSSPVWDRSWYPRTQAARYEILLDWIGLDVDAAFKSCSYGRFQILGENYGVCGSITPWAFAWQESRTEGDQFAHFCRFIEGNGLVPLLRAAQPGDPASCQPLTDRYNGTASRLNKYPEKYAERLRVRMGR